MIQCFFPLVLKKINAAVVATISISHIQNFFDVKNENVEVSNGMKRVSVNVD